MFNTEELTPSNHTRYNQLIGLINEVKKLDCSWLLSQPEFYKIEREISKYISSYAKAQKVSFGTNRVIYRIDKYVLKLGYFFTTEEIENFKFLNKIYYRVNHKFETADKVLYLGIEVSDFVEDERPVTREDLKFLYFSLRDAGYIWTDAKLSNVRKDKEDKPIIIDVENIYDFKKNKIDFQYCSPLTIEFEKEYKNNWN